MKIIVFLLFALSCLAMSMKITPGNVNIQSKYLSFVLEDLNLEEKNIDLTFDVSIDVEKKATIICQTTSRDDNNELGENFKKQEVTIKNAYMSSKISCPSFKHKKDRNMNVQVQLNLREALINPVSIGAIIQTKTKIMQSSTVVTPKSVIAHGMDVTITGANSEREFLINLRDLQISLTQFSIGGSGLFVMDTHASCEVNESNTSIELDSSSRHFTLQSKEIIEKGEDVEITCTGIRIKSSSWKNMIYSVFTPSAFVIAGASNWEWEEESVAAVKNDWTSGLLVIFIFAIIVIAAAYAYKRYMNMREYTKVDYDQVQTNDPAANQPVMSDEFP